MRSSKNEEQQQHKDHQARKRQRNSSDHTKEGMRINFDGDGAEIDWQQNKWGGRKDSEI